MVGATYPDQLGEVRAIVGQMPILVAGIGAQDGELEKTVQVGMDKNGRGLIINASRSILFASNGPDFAAKARAKAEETNASIRSAL
jgi:orotidine-5'-phosphate decarboxylase